MPTIVEETCTVTAEGQTTLPKAVRQALGLGHGGRIAFRVENGRVTVSNPQIGHRDPALAAFLKLVEKDIAAGRHVRDLPAGLTSALRKAKQLPVNFEEPLDGDVALQA